jgi:chromosome segregation ATPase
LVKSMKLDHQYIRQLYADEASDLSRARLDIQLLCDEIAALRRLNDRNLRRINMLTADLTECDEELRRCQTRLDTANAYAEGCAKQAGDLATGVLDALHIKWSMVCPDDRDIIQHVKDMKQKLDSALADSKKEE